MTKLKKYIDHLFENAPDTKEAHELKEEILSNLMEKYNDLLSEGYTESEACDIAIHGLGDISTLINSLEHPADNSIRDEVPKGRNGKRSILKIAVWSVLIIALCCALTAAVKIGFGSGFRYENAKLYTAGSGSVYCEGINDIEINWIDGDINIVQSKTGDITFTESENSDPMQYLVKGDKLIIQFCEPYRFMKKTSAKDLTIAVPAGTELRRLEISNVNGNIIGNKIFIQGDKLSLDTVNGSVEMDVYFREIDCDMVNGDVVFDLGDTPHEGEFDSVNGNFTLNVFHVEEHSEAEGFTAELDSVSGKISSDFEVSVRGDMLIYGSGTNELDFDTVSGDVQINKMKLE